MEMAHFEASRFGVDLFALLLTFSRACRLVLFLLLVQLVGRDNKFVLCGEHGSVKITTATALEDPTFSSHFGLYSPNDVTDTIIIAMC